MKILSFLLLNAVAIFIFIVPANAQAGKFTIAGEVTGFADGTVIYLQDLSLSSPTTMDSAVISNNKFSFARANKKNVLKVILNTKGFSDYKYFWVENAAITFKAEKGKFRQAVITGSKTQQLQDQLDAEIEKAGSDKQVSISFIQSHPNSIISAYTLNVYTSTWGKDTTVLLYKKLSPANKNTLYGKDILAFITLNKNIQIGDRYADFTEPDTEGKNVSLSDFKGKITLLEFWGTWCGPCREGNPELVKIYKEFKDSGFDILGVAADSDKKFWIESVKKDSLSWKNVCDLKGDKNKASLIYGISYYPASFLIDKKGIIVAKDLRGDDLRKKLRELLN